jgi:hypothetical protein
MSRSAFKRPLVGHESGYDLTPKKKQTGKLASVQDYAKVDWKPWKRSPDMQPGELFPPDKIMRDMGITARLAYGVMLRTRDELIGMYKNVDLDAIDEMMTCFGTCSEQLKTIVSMIDAAHARVLAAASAHVMASGEVKITASGKLKIVGKSQKS